MDSRPGTLCRIVYEGQGTVHADGTDEADLCRWYLKRRVDAALTTQNQLGVDSKTKKRRTHVTKDDLQQVDMSAEIGHKLAMQNAADEDPSCPSSAHDGESDGSLGRSNIEDALEAALDAAACGGVGFSSEEEWCSNSDSGEAERRNAELSLDGLDGTVMRSQGSGHDHDDGTGRAAARGSKKKKKKKKNKQKLLKAASPHGGLSTQPVNEDDTTPFSFSRVQSHWEQISLKNRFSRGCCCVSSLVPLSLCCMWGNENWIVVSPAGGPDSTRG